jgi:pilus assembly protein CpaE
MNPNNSTLDLRAHRGAHLLVNCHVFAKREFIVALERTLPSERSASLFLHPTASDEPVGPQALRQAQCIVLEVDPNDRFSLARLEQVRSARPSVPLIAAIENADFKVTRLLVRQGVFDVVSLPFLAEEVLSRLLDASAVLAAQSDVPLAPLISVIGAQAGVGATTVLTHLAAAMPKRSGQACCIIDLDLQFGQVANYLGVNPSASVLDLLEAGERLDADLVRNAAVASDAGPWILAAPPAIAPLEEVSVDQLLKLLDIARQEYGAVLLDMPANWTNWSLSAVAASTEIVLIADQSLTALRQAKRCLELFDAVEIPAAVQSVVLNRFEKRMLRHIGVDDVARTLGRTVRATLALEKSGLEEAQDQGLLLTQVSRRAKFSADVTAIAHELNKGTLLG